MKLQDRIDDGFEFLYGGPWRVVVIRWTVLMCLLVDLVELLGVVTP